jgi:hypothetical protein
MKRFVTQIVVGVGLVWFWNAGALARVKTPPCPYSSSARDWCEKLQTWMDRAAEAVYASELAARHCPNLQLNVQLIVQTIAEYGGFISDEYYGDVREKIEDGFFRNDPLPACQKAYRLYGPAGGMPILVRGVLATGFIRKLPTYP